MPAKYFSKVLFSNGEPMEEDDFNQVQDLTLNELRERAIPAQGLAGGAANLGHNSGQGFDLWKAAVGPVSAEDERIYMPTQFHGYAIIDDAADFLQGPGRATWLQRINANTPGTIPGQPADRGAQDGVVVHTGDDEEPNFDLTAISFPSVNPRIDSFDVRLGWEDGENVARDFEDATTRAKSSTATDKERRTLIAGLRTSGAEGASPAYPSVPAGYARWVTVLLETGDSLPLDHDRWQLHAFPSRLRVETVHGSEGWFSNASNWLSSGSSSKVLAAVMDGASPTVGTDQIFFAPRSMHAGCRLVGVAVVMEGVVEDREISLVRMDESGADTLIEALDSVTGSGPISTSGGDGVYFAGIEDLTAPVWGNGRAYGPIIGPWRGTSVSPVKPVSALSGFERLAVRMDWGGSTDWDANETIACVQFFYLE